MTQMATGKDAPGIPRVVKGAWLALCILCIINALKSVDRVLLGILAPDLKVEFHLTDSELGMLSVAFAVAYAGFAIPLGHWADRAPRRTVIATVLAIWSGMTAFCGLATSYVALFIGRMGVAVGESGFMPAAVSMLSDYFPPRMRNLGHGLLNSASSLGVFIGLALGGWLSAVYGWRAAFLILGLPGIGIALWVLFKLRETVRGGVDELSYDTPRQERVWARLLGNRMYMWIVLVSAFNVFSANGLVQWLPSFFTRVHHLPIATVGLAFGTAFGIGMIAGQLAGAALATRLAKQGIFRPLVICIWSNLLLIPCYLAAFWIPNAMAALGMVLVAAFLGAIGHGPQVASSQTALPPDLRGKGHALISFGAAIIGMGLAPLLVGVISDLFSAFGPSESLRYALCCSQLIFFVAAFAAWRAYRIGKTMELPS